MKSEEIFNYIISKQKPIKQFSDLYLEENILSSFENSIYDVTEGFFVSGGDWENICAYMTFERIGDKIIFKNITPNEDAINDIFDFEKFSDEYDVVIDEVNEMLIKKFGNDYSTSFWFKLENFSEEDGKLVYSLC